MPGSRRSRGGSPPHAWGKHKRSRWSVAIHRFTPTCVGKDAVIGDLPIGRDRFTPTCVGKAPRPSALRGFGSVHPHMRGESIDRKCDKCVRSVHPHMRGERRSRRSACRLSLTVHPHMRGESDHAGRKKRVPGGSPPHAWGKRSCAFRDSLWLTVHPHMRGESVRTVHPNQIDIGSPPHAWGKLHIHFFAGPRIGSPPHAWGKRVAPDRQSFAPAVHPHMRGESESMLKTFTVPVRFTPTCVGKARIPQRNRCLQSVHPHMRGESVCGCFGSNDAIGSPPHAWGKHQRHLPQPHCLRFTPTCVGKAGGRFGFRFSQGGSPPHAWGKLQAASPVAPA